MEDDSNVQIKQKGQRKSKKKAEPEPQVEETQSVDIEEYHEEEHHEEQVEQVEEPKKKTPAKKTASKEKKVNVEDYDIDQGPDVVIHKRHKGAKPRKIIVITGDSDVDNSDEELPYRAKPKIEVKKRQARAPSPEPEPKAKPAPKPAPPKKQNVGLIAGKPQVVDYGKGIPQRYHEQATAKKTGFVVDQYIDKLLGL